MENSGPEAKMAKNIWGLVMFWLALCFSVFQLTVPVFLNLIDLQLKPLHLIFGASLALLAHSFKKNAQAGTRPPIWDWILILILFVANINIFLSWQTIYAIPGSGTPTDWVLGALVILTVLEAGRRSTGLLLPILVLVMFVYVFMGSIMPGRWGHPGFSFEFVMESVYLSPLGMYGEILGYSSTFVAVFIIFGSLLLHTGGGQTFIDVGILVAGKYRGGPAKVAVISSAMVGTITGSPTANVILTGTYTIPLMKKLGYDRNFAGAVEVISDVGGIITPPIMGITAFIMAELIGVPYIKVCVYAIIPCLLYYACVFSGVHLEALRLDLAPVPKEEFPQWKSVLTWRRIVPFLVPIVILLWYLYKDEDLTTAGFYACIAAIIFFIFSNFSPSGIKERVVEVGRALSEGGESLAMIVPVMAIVGMLVNLLGITGLAPKVSELILDIGAKNLIGALLAGCIVPLALGAALPTSASYIISAALIAPALLGLGLDLVATHMFLLYWSALAAVTPPTCVAAVVAANLAGGNWLKVAMIGMKLGAVSFLMPFFFILEPALLMRGTPVAILVHFGTALVGTFFVSASLFGYLRSRINIPTRLLYGAGGLLLLFPGYKVSLIGAAIAAFAFVVERLFIKSKKSRLQQI